MSVEFYLLFEIVKNILVIAVLLLFAASLTFSILADIEKRKANKRLHKAVENGFNIEIHNIETDIDLEKVADEVSKRLEEVAKKGGF